MSYRSLLTDRCEIFKLNKKEESMGYGIECKSKEFYYDEEPTYIEVPCYFTTMGTGRGNIIQQDPNNKIYESYLVHFPIGIDIKVNYKVRKDGTLYKLQIPRSIRNHHIEVIAVREENL